MFFWPLFAHYKRNPGVTPLLWGYETTLGGMIRINYELFTSYMQGSIVTLDKSRFDKFYMFEIQDDIDLLVESFIDFDSGYMPTKEFYSTHETWTAEKATRLRRLFRWLNHCFRNAPTVLFDGSMYKRQWFGMPSGVYTTQYYDTLHFGITNTTVLFHMGFLSHHILLYKGEGDDIIFKLSVLLPPNVHSSFLTEYQRIDDEYFGSIIRPEKCEIHNTPNGNTVLGYTNRNGFPHRSTIDLLAQLYHTKQTHPDPSRTMAMAVGIAHASLCFDRRVYYVCRDIYNYYKRLGITPSREALRRTLYTGEPFSELPSCKEFPSIHEIQKSIFNFNYGLPPTMQTFWPDWFLADF